MDSRAESCKFHKYGESVFSVFMSVCIKAVVCSLTGFRLTQSPSLPLLVLFTHSARSEEMCPNAQWNRQKYRARNGDKNFEINSDELS
eukprot:scaffold24571_cov57-Phaeocystis_antarctica.AAC.3